MTAIYRKQTFNSNAYGLSEWSEMPLYDLNNLKKYNKQNDKIHVPEQYYC